MISLEKEHTVATIEGLPAPTIHYYPEKADAENSILNGTFDWSKTASSILFLKKHKCARKPF